MVTMVTILATVAWCGICQAIGVGFIPMLAGGALIGWMVGRLWK